MAVVRIIRRRRCCGGGCCCGDDEDKDETDELNEESGSSDGTIVVGWTMRRTAASAAICVSWSSNSEIIETRSYLQVNRHFSPNSCRQKQIVPKVAKLLSRALNTN